MTATMTPAPASNSYRMFAVACVVHSAAVLALWAATFLADLDLLSGKTWLAFAWLWLIWPVVLFIRREGSISRFAYPVLIGAVMLMPCIPVAFTYTVWSFQGFAP